MKGKIEQLQRQIKEVYDRSYGLLNLNCLYLTDEDILTILEHVQLSDLSYLRIEHNNITSKSIQLFLSRYPKISILFISSNQIDEETLKIINNLKDIKELRIYGSYPGLKYPKLLLSKAANLFWANLSLLILEESLGKGGCKNLSRMSMPVLISLFLKKNQIEDSGITHLGKSRLDSLLSLNLSENLIQRQYGIYLLKKGCWKKLKRVEIYSQMLTQMNKTDFIPHPFDKDCIFQVFYKKKRNLWNNIF